ncbi:hypothetical protein TRFO_35725 [Tritrichomonas foetus]|uniref:Uncharacterized protein n=1 Tax=Tritrichomonas foetus TaxID=1144522 RepID=A0A1J4JKZ0_9EUKA|nr:hypothetical protein TRFO_35725 [Tritrichomonas foetus]|eukprot:OHS97932.1 hypothetical protein TRFO_35725 [Tritrichomonas foetus]
MQNFFADALNFPGLELLDIDEQLRIFLASENPRQMYELGRKLFIYEEKTEKDSEICFKLMLAASENKIDESNYFLGKYYFEGIFPVSRNIDKAFYYFTRVTKTLYNNSNISSETHLQHRITRKLKHFHFKKISDKMPQIEREAENGFYQQVDNNNNKMKNKSKNKSDDHAKKHHRKERKEIKEIVSYSYLYLGFICENLYEFTNAYQMFIRSANLHNYDALAAISAYRISRRGGAHRNKNESMKLLKLCEEKGSIYALSLLSDSYFKGLCFMLNECKCFNYYCKAFLSKNLFSAAAIGINLYFARGIEPNETGKDIYYLAYYLSKNGTPKSSKFYQKLFQLLQPYIEKYQKSPKYSHLTDHVHNTLFNSFCCQQHEQISIFSFMGLFFNGYHLNINPDRGFNIYVKGFLQKSLPSTRNLGISYRLSNSGCTYDEDQLFHLYKLSKKYQIFGISGESDYLLGNCYFEQDFKNYNPLKGVKHYMQAIKSGHIDSYSKFHKLLKENKVPISSTKLKLRNDTVDSLSKLNYALSRRQYISQLAYIQISLKNIYKQGNKLSMYLYGRELLFSNDQKLINKGRKIIEKALQYGYFCTELGDIRYDVAELMDLSEYSFDKNNRSVFLFLMNIGSLHGFSTCHDILAFFMEEFKYPKERILKHFRKSGLLENGYTRKDYADHLTKHYKHEFDKFKIASEMYLINNNHNEYKAVINTMKSIMD